jgi:hypothetical protein
MGVAPRYHHVYTSVCNAAFHQTDKYSVIAEQEQHLLSFVRYLSGELKIKAYWGGGDVVPVWSHTSFP